MPLLRNSDGDTVKVSLKAATLEAPNASAAFSVSDVDWVRVQATETNGIAWDSGTLKLQFSLDGRQWYDSGTALSQDGISAKADVIAVGFVRLARGTEATSATPIIDAVIYGGNQS